MAGAKGSNLTTVRCSRCRDPPSKRYFRHLTPTDVTNGWPTRSLKHLCIGDMSPPAYIKYLSLTPHVGSFQCLHVGNQEGSCFWTIEQYRHYLCLVQVYFGVVCWYCESCISIPSESGKNSAFRAWSPASAFHGIWTLLVPGTRTATGQRSFAVNGPRTWNSLPAELRTPDTTLCSFKRHLKAHLFQQ